MSDSSSMRDVLKAGAKVGLATLAGLMGSVVTGKILALQLGAAGVGLYGILRQLLQNITLVGSFNGQSALVQGIARRPDKTEQNRFSASVLCIQFILSATLALILLLGAPWLGPWLIPHPQAIALLRWLALAMLVLVANAYVLGLLNGHRLINELVKFQLLGPATTLILIFPVIWLIRGGHTFGFLLMLVGPAAVITLVAARAVWRAGYLPVLRGLVIHWADGAQFIRMSAVLTTAGIIATGTQFGQSWMVAKWMGLAQAGQFWTAWTLSMTYLTLVLGSLGTYYMPSLSRLEDPVARRDLIRMYLRLVLQVTPLLVSIVIVFKPWVIQGMFSSTMLPALKVMRWMLIGDFFKAVSYILAYPMVAFNDMKWFFWTDVLFSLGFAVTFWAWLFQGGGIEGLGTIFMLVYILYLLFTMFYIRVKHGFVFTQGDVGRFLAALALILLLSACTWRSESVSWRDVGCFILMGGIYSAISLRGVSWRTLLPQWTK
jgi:O-antigen/teichoic acid export membrane protein